MNLANVERRSIDFLSGRIQVLGTSQNMCLENHIEVTFQVEVDAIDQRIQPSITLRRELLENFGGCIHTFAQNRRQLLIFTKIFPGNEIIDEQGMLQSVRYQLQEILQKVRNFLAEEERAYKKNLDDAL